jgi:hypothetical protein
MKQSSFTAKELFAMAYLLRKHKMYGIPNAIGPERNAVLQTVFDGLVAQGVADMDIDGHITVRSEYFAMINTICDCQKCLTINVRKDDAREHSLIFWAYNGAWVMSEVVEDRYVFSKTDTDMIKAIYEGFLYAGETKVLSSQAVVPQMDIVKAKRACLTGNYTEAVRLVRQCGIDPVISNVIADGLQGNAYYLGLVYMDMRQGDCKKQEVSFICSDGVLLSLDQMVANLRTCATFTPISRDDLRNRVDFLLNSFLEKGT